MVLPQKLHWNMIFLVLSEKMKFFFTEIFFGRKMKDYVSPRNTCKYDIFCICGISFSYKYNTTLLSKRKDDLFPKMHLKITFQYHWKRWLYFFFVPVEVVYSFNFLIDVFWNSICLTFITQFGWKDLAYDYLFNFQRVSLCSRYGFFYYTFTYFVPIWVIKDRVIKSNSKYLNGKLWPLHFSWLINYIYMIQTIRLSF